MARSIDRDPDNPRMALWLSQARRVVESVDPKELEPVVGRRGHRPSDKAEQLAMETGLPISRIREYVRLYKFLVDHFPNVEYRQTFDANFAAVTLLAQLCKLSRPRALELAEGVFYGEIKAADLRPIVDELVAESTASPGTRRMLAKRRGADFVRHVVERVQANPDVLGIGPIDEIVTPPARARFAPALLVRQGERWTAVDVQLGGDTASPYDVGRYLARLAQLEQKYNDAILVLPRDNEEMSEMARRFQREWIDRDVHIVLIEEPGPLGGR